MSIVREFEEFFAWSLVSSVRVGFILVGVAAAILLWPITIVVGAYYLFKRFRIGSKVASSGFVGSLNKINDQVQKNGLYSTLPERMSPYMNLLDKLGEILFIYGSVAVLPYCIWMVGGELGEIAVVLMAGIEGALAVFLFRRILSSNKKASNDA
ncbi:hypothetical protein GJR96_07840 [Haloferax sp. MBLA0076]|uniref:Uncharacterized protein n=2 Tax=Haloferax litoreum TaxID=2666140 RepID=A0A6A8GG62_9EURY|nr:hypothetical protein [Haloferax sp. CBA1148]KAB1193357.1 hypothetical protein Hfx1148_07830 [Haloferax sp. CBA1148]MRX21866.1 hypothetical protein [Haloferax litoreum]